MPQGRSYIMASLFVRGTSGSGGQLWKLCGQQSDLILIFVYIIREERRGKERTQPKWQQLEDY
jgi:hypothetical protein